MIQAIKPKGATWRDWIASSTNKMATAVFGLYSALLAGNSWLVDLGIPEEWVTRFMAIMGIAVAVGIANRRAVTTEPLEGRAE